MEVRSRFSSLLTPITTIISIISAIVYITFYASTLDKRIAVIESQSGEFQSEMAVMRDNIVTINDYQNQEQSQFHSDVSAQLDQMSRRIEKIYSILLETNKKHEYA